MSRCCYSCACYAKCVNVPLASPPPPAERCWALRSLQLCSPGTPSLQPRVTSGFRSLTGSHSGNCEACALALQGENAPSVGCPLPFPENTGATFQKKGDPRKQSLTRIPVVSWGVSIKQRRTSPHPTPGFLRSRQESPRGPGQLDVASLLLVNLESQLIRTQGEESPKRFLSFCIVSFRNLVFGGTRALGAPPPEASAPAQNGEDLASEEFEGLGLTLGDLTVKS